MNAHVEQHAAAALRVGVLEARAERVARRLDVLWIMAHSPPEAGGFLVGKKVELEIEVAAEGEEGEA